MNLSHFRKTLAFARASRAPLQTYLFLAVLLTAMPVMAGPRIIVISLDGATPRIVKDLLKSGALPSDSGIGLLKRRGVWADKTIRVRTKFLGFKAISFTIRRE
jgi:hypothetical protein